jgi:hypothetical protein
MDGGGEVRRRNVYMSKRIFMQPRGTRQWFGWSGRNLRKDPEPSAIDIM